MQVMSNKPLKSFPKRRSGLFCLALLVFVSVSACSASNKDKEEGEQRIVDQEITLPLTGRLNDIHYVDNYLVLARGSQGVSVVSLTHEWVPVHIADLPLGSNVQNITSSGREVYLWDQDQGLKVLNLNEPSSPKELQSFSLLQLQDVANDIAVYPANPPMLLLASHLKGILGLEISSSGLGDRPLNLADLRSVATEIEIVGDNVFAAEFERGFSIFHVDGPQALRPIGRYNLPERTSIGAFAVSADANWLYTASYSDKNGQSVEVLDISNPGQPVSVSQIQIPSDIIDLIPIDSGLLALVQVTDSIYGLQYINLADVTAPALAGRQTFEGRARKISRYEDRYHVLVEDRGLVQISLVEGL